MTAAIEATDLGKRYGNRQALQHTTLSVPAGKVVGLVGANGAGKSTLLHLAVGLLEPSEGEIRVIGERPGGSPDHMGKVGFVAQDAPVYRSLSIADHLEMGAKLNPSWPRSASPGSGWTGSRRPGRCRAANDRNWPSRSPSASALSSSCSTSRSPASIPSLVVSSSRT